MALNELLGGFNIFGGGGFMDLFYVILAALLGVTVIGGLFWYIYAAKRWNIKKVYFNIPRDVEYLKKGEELDINDVKGNVIKEVGKGSYDAKNGVVYVKRKGKKKCAMEPFNIAEYLLADGSLEVMQISQNNFIPCIPKSYLLYRDDDDKMSALVNLKTDLSKSKMWKTFFERSSKNAFSVTNLLKEYQTPIIIGLVIVLWGIQLLILYNRIK